MKKFAGRKATWARTGNGCSGAAAAVWELPAGARSRHPGEVRR